MIDELRFARRLGRVTPEDEDLAGGRAGVKSSDATGAIP